MPKWKNMLLNRRLMNFLSTYTEPLFSDWLGVGSMIILVNLALLVKWYICYWMYKKKLFIKI